MGDKEYDKNRQRLAEIQGVNLSSGEYNCHHWFIRKRDAKARPALRPEVNKLNNLFLMTREDHARVEELLKGEPCVIDSPIKHGRRRGKHRR